MKKEFIFLGPPACGKGTQTEHLANFLKFPHVDTGSLLRAEIKKGTDEGKIAKERIDNGQLVPLELVGKIIKNRLEEDDCKNGYILDGYPRSVEQADILEKINSEIDEEPADFRAIYFEIDEDLLLDRIVYRRSCPKCGEIYNLKFKPPKKEGYCDCGEKLIQRSDDNKEVAQKRFDTYFEQTAPLVDYYEKKNLLRKIDASGSIDEVWQNLLKEVQ